MDMIKPEDVGYQLPEFVRPNGFDYSKLEAWQNDELAKIEKHIHTAYLTGVQQAMAIGELLEKAKAVLKGIRGAYGDWYDLAFPMLPRRTATRYMALARDAKSANLAVLDHVAQVSESSRKRRATIAAKRAEAARAAKMVRITSAVEVLTMMWAYMPKEVYHGALLRLRTSGSAELYHLSSRLSEVFPEYEAHQKEILDRNAKAVAEFEPAEEEELPPGIPEWVRPSNRPTLPWDADIDLLREEDENRVLASKQARSGQL